MHQYVCPRVEEIIFKNKLALAAILGSLSEPCLAVAIDVNGLLMLQDCTGDGVVDCYDYAALHRLGGYGCRGNLDALFRDKFNNCMVQVSQLNGGSVI